MSRVIYTILILLCVGLTLTTSALAEGKGSPYLEFRYSLFSNKPSLIGYSECPCYASEVIVGYEYKKSKFSFDVNHTWVYHTRWDDPEIAKYNLNIGYQHTKWFKWLVGYEITHNLDRFAVIPYKSQVEWNGTKEIKTKDDYFGISGLHYNGG